MSDPKALAVLALKRVKPDAKGDGADSETGPDYDPAKASMQAFIDAVKGGDVAAALDAYHDVQKNCTSDDAGP